MIKNKIAVICSILLLCGCLALYYSFSEKVMIEAHSAFMSFPITDRDGYILRGVLGAVLFILAMFLLAAGLEKYRARIVFLVIVAYAILPHALVATYQHTFASGISAVSYDEEGACDMEYIGNDVVEGKCYLSLHNRSDETVTFEMEFMDSRFREGVVRLTSLMNIAGPYTITLGTKEEKTIELEKSLDVSDVPDDHIVESGSSLDVHIKMLGEDGERIL